MDSKRLTELLDFIAASNNREKQISILRDIYLIGQLDAYENPTAASTIMEQIKHVRILDYGSKWSKESDNAFSKTIDGKTATIYYKEKGHKIYKGVKLSTNITGSLSILSIPDGTLADIKKRAEDILLKLSGNDCSKLKHI